MRTKDPLVFFRTKEILEQPWKADTWFAWTRIMALCRQRRACTPRTYPAAVLELAPRDLCWLLGRARMDTALRILVGVQKVHEVVLGDARGLVLDPAGSKASELLAKSYRRPSFRLTVCKYAILNNFSFKSTSTTSETPLTPIRPPPRARSARLGRVISMDEEGQRAIDAFLSDEEKQA